MSELLVNFIIQVIASAFGDGVGGFILLRLLPSLQNAASALDWGVFISLVACSTLASAILTLVAAVVRDRTA
jgi:hypothetical protein